MLGNFRVVLRKTCQRFQHKSSQRFVSVAGGLHCAGKQSELHVLYRFFFAVWEEWDEVNDLQNVTALQNNSMV